MPKAEPIIDLATLDLGHVISDQEAIRSYNPQRYEMEQLTAVIYEDPVAHICVGYRDVTEQEFWVRGHMPGMPLMPGVIMCEAAAQLSAYFSTKFGLLGSGAVVGLGGLDEVRVRESVYPGDRFYIVCQLEKVRRGRIIICRFQGFARDSLVVEGKIKGIPLPGSDEQPGR